MRQGYGTLRAWSAGVSPEIRVNLKLSHYPGVATSPSSSTLRNSAVCVSPVPRYLTVNGHSALELSCWCGTCGFVLERLEGANTTLSVAAPQDRFDEGLTSVDDDVVATASELLPEGRDAPLLLEITPTLVYPFGTGDYFSEEKVFTWGVDPFWGLPTYPRTPYYRGDARDLAITEMNASV